MDLLAKDIAGRYDVVAKNSNDTQLTALHGKLLERAVAVLSRLDYERVIQPNDIHSASRVGELFINKKHDLPAVYVDLYLSEIKSDTFEYVDYTTHQNYLMHNHKGLLRFYFTDLSLESEFESEVRYFIKSRLAQRDENELELKMYGEDRSESHADPTPPEFNFAMQFSHIFGEQAVHALKPEANYIDASGTRRFIDFLLKTKHGEIAIELNGERYHHPRFTNEKQYRSQLFKQNSLVSDAVLVYRWSDRGMQDKVKFGDQMRLYFGEPTHFENIPNFKQQRQVHFEHYPHQTAAIRRISEERAKGDSAFLVVLPTGTGKTEVFIEDLASQIVQSSSFSALAIVPTRALKEQLITRINEVLPNLATFTQFDDDQAIDYPTLTVVTSAFAIRHYKYLPRDRFDYLLVDEAHRAGAAGLKALLEYFRPSTLLGLTATPDRTDQQKLERIFGEYEVDLTLEQAIEDGLVPPIRAYRLESNIDFSKVRFNGQEFVKSDLNKTVITPSRDQLIVDILKTYFNNSLAQSGFSTKQGVIFCVDVAHSKRMAKRLNDHGISAVSVDGKNRTGIKHYLAGDVSYICACDLLNEGWDAPQTSVVVMARPTMSKVLYTQQLGRGTRKYKNKEALYVIDVVDSYGASLVSPWNVHSLFGIKHYIPFGDVVETKTKHQKELMILDGLYEGVRRLEPINIFDFEKEYGQLLNEEQLARELFVSTGTVKQWRKKGDILPTKQLPFGSRMLSYYSPFVADEIRATKGLKIRTKETRKDDFFEFLEERDYTFSYKIVFLLMFIEYCNERGEIELDILTQKYQAYYLSVFERFGKVDKVNSPLNRRTFLDDKKALQKNILANPFEKFERKRFMYQSDELNLLSFDESLWQQLTKVDLEKAKSQYENDANEYFEKVLGAPIRS